MTLRPQDKACPAEKKLSYELIECDLSNKPEDLLRLNPYAKVPVLVDGDGVIYESAIIDEYLEEKYPQVPLLPRDPLQRARARIWIDYCNTRLQQAGGYIAHDHEVEKSKEKVRGYLATLNQEMREREYIARRLFFSGYYLHPVLLPLAALPNDDRQRSAARESLDATSARPPGRASDAVRKVFAASVVDGPEIEPETWCQPRVQELSLKRDAKTDLRNPRGAVRRERYPAVRILWRHEQRE